MSSRPNWFIATISIILMTVGSWMVFGPRSAGSILLLAGMILAFTYVDLNDR